MRFERPLHGSLQSLLLGFGLTFFLLGALVFPHSTEMWLTTLNAPHGGDAINCLNMAILTGGMTAFGGYLICKGTRAVRGFAR